MIDNETLQTVIIKEYEKSQKNIQPVWVGEGWYKGTPNSFNYFSSGFEAGMEFYKQLNIAKQVMIEDSDVLRNLSK
jgi:hypothetical protein